MYDTTKPYISEIERIIRTTWDTKYLRVDERGIHKKKPFDYTAMFFDHVDGIGTKGMDHWRKRTFDAAVTDVLAMNLNDFCLARAIPTSLCDHIFLPTDDREAIVQIVSHLAAECNMRHIAITAGETAIHDNMNGMEISMMMSGFKRSVEPNQYRQGDILIGIGSSGAHASGFTRIHSVYDDWELLPESITTPTLIYIDVVDSIDRVFGIHGMTHITGGAFTKIKRFLGTCDAHIGRSHNLEPHSIFWDLLEKGIPEKEMYQTFNCGIGFVIGVPVVKKSVCLSTLKEAKFNADIIGNVTSGSGNVHIQSKFSDQEYIY